MIDIILAKYPGIQHVVYWHTRQDGSNWEHPYDGLIWENTEIPKPSKEEIAQWEVEFSVTFLSKKNSDLRYMYYPSIDELIVAMWKKTVEGDSTLVNELQAKRLLVKAAYPKTLKETINDNFVYTN